MSERDRRIAVREVCAADSARIAELSGQLGYPATPEEVSRRLEQLLQKPDHAVFVASMPEAETAGWVHVHLSYQITGDRRAEIAGLVVDAAHRGSGAGRRLVERAEEWAREQGCGSVYVRSNIVRAGAHAFYQRLGYSVLKTSYSFRKELQPEPARFA